MKRLLLLVLVLAFSCQGNNDTPGSSCGVSNPLYELPWLSDIRTSYEQSASATKRKIFQYTYHGEVVFLIDPCTGCADGSQFVYDCSGNEICEFGGIAGLNTCPDFSTNSSNEILLWEN